MKAKKIIDFVITIIDLFIFMLTWYYVEVGLYKYIILVISFSLSIVFYYLAVKKDNKQEILHFTATHSSTPTSKITEVVLLSEEDTEVYKWDLYNKTSMVIGRDIGENHVDINLNHTAEAGLIDREHAVLNYCLNNWYIEDLGTKNGISIKKVKDGRRYKLAPDTPCKLDRVMLFTLQ